MNDSTVKQTFYVSIDVEQLVLTQGSVLGELIERWNVERRMHQTQKEKANKKNRQNQTNSQSEIPQLLRTKQQEKAVFLFQLFQFNGLKKTELCNSISIARVDSVETTSKVYQYPINLTSVGIKAKDELTSFVYHYSPMNDQQVILMVSLKLSDKKQDEILVGQCVIDLNLFVEMFLDDSTQCVKDCKRLVKKIDSLKIIDQKVDAVINLYIQRDRVSLERVKTNSNKGINVVDFKQQIKRIIREKKLINFNSQKEQEVFDGENSPNTQQIPEKQKQKSNHQNLSEKFHKYLQRNVEERLTYIHPKKELIQNQVNSLMKQRKQYLINEKSSKVFSSVQKMKQNENKKCEKLNKNQTDKIKSEKDDKKESTQKQKQNDIMEKVKIIIFVVVVTILLYLAMTPSKKVELGPV